MLLKLLVCTNAVLIASAMTSPPPPPPVPRYKECPNPNPRNPFAVLHMEHGCWNLFSGVGILSEIIPSPPPPPPRMAITTTIIAQPLANHDSHKASDTSENMAHTIGNGMQRAFSLGDARTKRGIDDEPWYKKGQSQRYNTGRKSASRSDSRSADSASSLFNYLPMPPPFAPNRGMPMMDVAAREDIDKKVCEEWKKQATLLVKQGSLKSQCCQLDCYCMELETGDKETCGGRVAPPPYYAAPPRRPPPQHMSMGIPIHAMSRIYGGFGGFPEIGGYANQSPFYPSHQPPPPLPQPSMYPYRAPTGQSTVYAGAFPTGDDSQPGKNIKPDNTIRN